MPADDVADIRRRFEDIAKHETEATAKNAAKNEAETVIYGVRDKIEREDTTRTSSR